MKRFLECIEILLLLQTPLVIIDYFTFNVLTNLFYGIYILIIAITAVCYSGVNYYKNKNYK